METKNPKWIGHPIREYANDCFSLGEEASFEFRDPSTYLLMTSVLKKLGYQYSTSPIIGGTKFTIDNKVSLDSNVRSESERLNSQNI